MSRITNATCVLTTTVMNSIRGVIKIKEVGIAGSIIRIDIIGLPPGDHGFHIHKDGDLSQGFQSLCSHYNPFNQHHGGPNSIERHLGDLGNIHANINGEIHNEIFGKGIFLNGEHSVIGRSIVIHENRDDLGLGVGSRREGSLKTGNAGKRIAAGVIGIA